MRKGIPLVLVLLLAPQAVLAQATTQHRAAREAAMWRQSGRALPTVSQLPACNSSLSSERGNTRLVTDAQIGSGGVVTGGGTTAVYVLCDGEAGKWVAQ